MYRLKRHYAQYEPTLQQLKKKYEVAMKEKMLSKLEKDRAVGQVAGLQSTLKSMESFKGTPPSGFQTGMCMQYRYNLYKMYLQWKSLFEKLETFKH